MEEKNKLFNKRQLWYWAIGFFALLWILIRTGTNPKRLTYPCQQAAFPLASSWLLAVVAFFSGSLILRKFVKLSSVVIFIAGVFWFVGILPELPRAEVTTFNELPVWEVDAPVSTIFIMDKIPPTIGSLAVGDASVPDEYLSDPAIDTLLAMMKTKGIYLHKTAGLSAGIVGANNIVVIKGNFQWTSRNTTSTDRIKGLIWQILQHPDGFTGEILIYDNTQTIGTGINQNDNNSEDSQQSIPDVVNTFAAKGYPVYYHDWRSIWSTVAAEYSTGDNTTGYVYEADTKISYPKFRSPSGYSCTKDSSEISVFDRGVLSVTSIGSTGVTHGIESFQLYQNYPNPFNAQTTITFKLIQPTQLRLHIFDINGRLVKSFARGELLEAGHHSISWKGKDDRGQTVSSGVYFYKIETENNSQTKRMILLK